MKTLHIGLIAGLLVALGICTFTLAIPLRTDSGIIDATRNQCPSIDPVTKHYHLLLGQLHDFRLVRAHLVAEAGSDRGCGQHAQIKLYL